MTDIEPAPHPVDIAARHCDLAREELANGHPAAAVAALKQALALDPQRVPAHYNLGVALEELERFDEAEAAYRNALGIDPGSVAALHNLGELLRRGGELEEAARCFESALGIDSTLNRTRLSLAGVRADLGELDKAASCYKEAIAARAAPAGIYMHLGTVLWKLGDSSGALDAFERSVAGGSSSAEAYYNLGSAQLEAGKFADAAFCARQALRLRPGFSEALLLGAAALAATGAVEAGIESLTQPGVALAARYLLLASRLMSSRLFEPARECLRKALLEDPEEVMARHLLSALSGDNPDHPADGYVRQVFEASAASFDRELMFKLGYGIPREMVGALRTVNGAAGARWDVLDLGCGTGLVGVELAPYSGRVVGVDLAPKMIELARERGIYTELRCADLSTALAEEQARYDVVTAADVFIYVGKLDAAIPAIRRVLRPGGFFAFSAEAAEADGRPTPEGYRLGVMGRYAHSAEYLRRLAAQHNFAIEMLRETRIRFEHRRPVAGWLTVWRAA